MLSNRTDNKEVLNIKVSGTYKKILRLIVEHSMATLPNDMYKVFGGDSSIFTHLQPKLIEMRQSGRQYLAYDKYNKKFYKDVEVRQYGSEVVFLVNNQPIDSQYILVIGDYEDEEAGKLILDKAELNDIARYENMLESLDDDYKNSYRDFLKTKEGGSMDTNMKQSFARKMQDLLTRKKNHIIQIDTSDELGTIKREIQDVRWILEERKSKICLNHSIPWDVLFGDTVSGLNNTGDGVRKLWNMSIRFFQIQRIYPVLLRFSTMAGYEKAFSQIDFEPIETNDKLLESQIAENYRNIYEQAYLSNAISDKEYTSLVRIQLGLDNKG
ncbi:MAG: DUF1073 domain-containing protein [Alphaproteobacteria bacterium]|jgi:hypothetical protein|nr:DUF1073 domain-containing protein [Alphaproteobacteria bacterium]